jgi:cation diffusion facilitator CzcD-associated flavoprotein CzcO
MNTEHFDVIIMGAGLSGIGAGVHLKRDCPGHSFAILEGREAMGGTWDLFRYPGVRSDSDMYTLGYAFRPWTDAKSIADGKTILGYIQTVSREHGIDQHIRYAHRIKSAAWSSTQARWLLQIRQGPDRRPLELSCNFFFICGGYYNYEHGYTPDFAGLENFKGQVVHPQKWSPDIETAGKKVVVIGSGATAVTLVPALAKSAAHVTMLQRSPTYIMSRPAHDALANWLNKYAPVKLAYAITRWKNVLLGMLFYKLSKAQPERIKRMITQGVQAAMPPGFDVKKHFTPNYKPWDQRVCLIPNADLFKAIRSGAAAVVTDQIESFEANGLRLASGDFLEADLVVTATGLDLLTFGGIEILVDGVTIDLPKTISFKGLMLNGVPNMAYAMGYTNASWTLKSDLTCNYVVRVLNHMAAHKKRQCTPVLADASVKPENWIDFTSGYVQRSLDKFPKQGNKKPWKLHQNYVLDIFELRYGELDDGTLIFTP